MDWTPHLEEGEVLRWEGRPAPRCFTFRRWRLSLYGFLLLLLSAVAFVYVRLWGEAFGHPLTPFFLLPFILLGFYLAVGHVLLARREWENVFFAATDRRILARRGAWRVRIESLPLSQVTHFVFRPLGKELGSFHVQGEGVRRPLEICCIEHPGPLAILLEEALATRICAVGKGTTIPE